VDIDLPTFNALTDAFVRNGRLGQAEAVLDQMAAVGIAPSTL
jgi:pentatricopeptide repeat protein